MAGEQYVVFTLIPLGMFLFFFKQFFEIDLDEAVTRGALYFKLIIKYICLGFANIFFWICGVVMLEVAKAESMADGFTHLAEGMLNLSGLFFFLVTLFWGFAQIYFLFYRNVDDALKGVT